MSVTLQNKTKRTKKWQPNVSGWRLCGFINAFAGCPFYIEGFYQERGVDLIDLPRPPDDATEEQAGLWASRINSYLLGGGDAAEYFVETRQIRFALLLKKSEGLFEGSEDDLKTYVKQYHAWLVRCGGYETLS